MTRMYFIIKTNLDLNNSYTSNDVVAHSGGGIANAQNVLLAAVKTFVAEISGMEMASSLKVIDIHSFDQIVEPIIDTILLYRLDVEPHYIHVWQRKSAVVPGRLYGQSVDTIFRRIKIFSMCEYNAVSGVPPPPPKSKTESNENLVPFGPSGIKIPEKNTMAPIADVIASLKSSPIFIRKYNESIGSVPKPIPGPRKRISGFSSKNNSPSRFETSIVTEIPLEVRTENPIETQTESLTEVQTESPIETQTESPIEIQMEFPTEVLTELPTEISAGIDAGVLTIQTESPKEIQPGFQIEIPIEFYYQQPIGIIPF